MPSQRIDCPPRRERSHRTIGPAGYQAGDLPPLLLDLAAGVADFDPAHRAGRADQLVPMWIDRHAVLPECDCLTAPRTGGFACERHRGAPSSASASSNRSSSSASSVGGRLALPARPGEYPIRWAASVCVIPKPWTITRIARSTALGW